MAQLPLLQSNRLQQPVRSASLPGLRVAHRHATFVRSSRDAQLQQMQEYKQHLAQRLAAASEAGAAAAAPATTTAPDLVLIDQESFYPTLEAAGDRLVVVDFYTAWCGPCKMIYPTLCELNAELKPQGVDIYKFECNKANKELGMKLNIKVAPTFHLYRKGEKVAEMTGAKVDKLKELIDQHK